MYKRFTTHPGNYNRPLASRVLEVRTRRPPRVSIFAGVLFALVLPGFAPASGHAATILAVDSSNNLLQFESATPGTITKSTPITGLTSGESVLGIDFRPATGELYALGNSNRLYTLNVATAVATEIESGTFAVGLNGTEFGFDFDPVTDRIRVVSNAEQNLRINPNTGTVVDANPATPGDQSDTNLNPPGTVVGSAYSNNFAGATATTLFGIDADPGGARLVRQGGVNGSPSPNGGEITPTGPLNLLVTSAVLGFDIEGAAYAALRTSQTGSVGLYTINLDTGAATFLGDIGDGTVLIRGLAVVPVAEPLPILYAVDTGNNLVRFSSTDPATILSSNPIVARAGAPPVDEIVGLDFRPATGELFGLGQDNHLYAISSPGGGASQRGSSGQFTLNGTAFGFDFNPVADRIRVTSNNQQNLRLNPNDGTVAGSDSGIAYAPGDPNFGFIPDVVGGAYTNNFIGATTTTLFGIDTVRNVLVRQGGTNVPPGTPSPNSGQIFTVGPLGINPTSTNAGFDIYTTAEGTELAFAALRVDGSTYTLYRINLATGAATEIGDFAGLLQVRALAAAPIGAFEFSAPTYSVGESGPVASITVNRVRGKEGIVTVRFSTSDGTATVADLDYGDSDQVLVFSPNMTSRTITIPLGNDTTSEPDETVNLTLSNPTGGAGLGVQNTAVLTIINDDGAPPPSPTPTATPTPTPVTTLANISTRLRVETGDNVLIGGFIVTGTQAKKVIVRAIGTSLPLADKLADPTMELHGPNGLIEANDNWMDSPNMQAIIDSTIPPTSNLESAIVQTLPANNAGYTAIVRGVNEGTGIALVEAYDLDIPANSKLANISTRGFVQTGDNVLIAGTIVVGQTPQRVLIRAIGPSLPIVGKMENPTLELRDSNGGLLQTNDNWVDSPDKQEIIDTTIPPTNDLESAIVAMLPADNASYTAIVRGVGDTTGIAVVEVYALQ